MIDDTISSGARNQIRINPIFNLSVRQGSACSVDDVAAASVSIQEDPNIFRRNWMIWS